MNLLRCFVALVVIETVACSILLEPVRAADSGVSKTAPDLKSVRALNQGEEVFARA